MFTRWKRTAEASTDYLSSQNELTRTTPPSGPMEAGSFKSVSASYRCQTGLWRQGKYAPNGFSLQKK